LAGLFGWSIKSPAMPSIAGFAFDVAGKAIQATAQQASLLVCMCISMSLIITGFSQMGQWRSAKGNPVPRTLFSFCAFPFHLALKTFQNEN
jgi:hypothetical protein